MLPIYKKNKIKVGPGLIVKTRTPDEKPVGDMDESDPKAAMRSAAQDLMSAISSGSADAVAEALMNAFQIADSMPHVEGDHVEPHSYDAQNQKAAE